MGFFRENILPWFHTPGTYTVEGEDGSNVEKERFGERDNIWSDFHIFNGEWIRVSNKQEWYESPNVPTIYAEHKYLFKNMGLGRPYEEFYMQDLDSGEFESEMYREGSLPSGKGSFRIDTTIDAKTPPSGENDFALVEYDTDVKISYNMPKGIQNLPRILAYPLNRFFKWAFIKYIGEEMIERDGEYARDKLLEYFEYIRKYHGEEPVQAKTREASFDPSPEEGLFFR